MSPVDVGLIVAGAVGNYVADFLQAQIVRIGGTPHIRHQSQQVQIRILTECIFGHFSSISQLRDCLGTDKGSKFHMPYTSLYQQVNNFLFQLRGNKVTLDTLETIPGADFNDADLFFIHTDSSYLL